MVGSILKYVCPHNPNLDISESSFIFELCQNRNNSAAFLFPGQTACTAYILHTHWFWKFETSTRVTSVCLWLIRRVTTRVYVTCHDSRVTCPTHQRLDEPPAEAPHLLQVAVDVEDPVLLAELDVGVDGDVDTGPPGAVTDTKSSSSSSSSCRRRHRYKIVIIIIM